MPILLVLELMPYLMLLQALLLLVGLACKKLFCTAIDRARHCHRARQNLVFEHFEPGFLMTANHYLCSLLLLRY